MIIAGRLSVVIITKNTGLLLAPSALRTCQVCFHRAHRAQPISHQLDYQKNSKYKRARYAE